MKQYNNEDIVISLTSWTKRIGTAYKTIDSLLKWCGYCHIVLVLAEEEFPNKEADLPDSIKNYLDNDKIELLWVDKNYITYKKTFFTAIKYPTAIIVSADDDKVYTEDFVSELYGAWKTNKKAVVSYVSSVPIARTYKCTCCQYGEATLYPPNYYGTTAIDLLEQDDIFDIIKKYPNDDIFNIALRSALNRTDFILINRSHSEIAVNHDEVEVITSRRNMKDMIPGSDEYNATINEINNEYFSIINEVEDYIKSKLKV